MDTPRWITIMLGSTAVAVAVAVGLGATAGEPDAVAVPSAPSALSRSAALPDDAPSWMAGLLARSEALNRMHGLGDYAPRAAAADELRGLDARSAALNRTYGLGD